MAISTYPKEFVRYDSHGREVTQLTSAFGEPLFAQLSPVFQVSFEYTVDNTRLTRKTLVGSGTVIQADAMAVIATGVTTGSIAGIRTAHEVKYRAGIGTSGRFTVGLDTPVAGTRQIAAIADKLGSSAIFKNGHGLGYDGTTIQLSRFKNDVEIVTLRPAWDDPLDGTGISGVDIDFQKGNVYYIQSQHLGFGAVNYWVEHPYTGVPFIFHQVKYTNRFTVPSTYNPNFSTCILVLNQATTSNITMKTGSFGVFIEGMTSLIELQQPRFSSGIITQTGITTEVPILSIRNKALYNTYDNFIGILMLRWTAAIEAAGANNLGRVRLVKNAILTGPTSWTDINATDSVTEIDVASTGVSGGEEELSVELAGKNDKIFENLLDYKIIFHPEDTFTIVGSSAGSATIKVSTLHRELI